MTRRVDTGMGFPLVHDLTSAFYLAPAGEGTELTYEVTYRFGLGSVGQVIHRVPRGRQPAARRRPPPNRPVPRRSAGRSFGPRVAALGNPVAGGLFR